jgi:phospholipid/cholesterol/gamma-HCH transport system ATP-binding protein
MMTPKQNPILSAHGLVAGYDGRAVLQGIDLKIQAGEIRVVLGGSGCGKSTLLQSLLGLLRAWEGSLDLMGQHFEFPQQQIPGSLLRQMGVLFQHGALLSSLTVAQNVALPLTLHRPDLHPKLVDEMVLEVLEKVRMVHAWHRLPGELSGGMRKRAALARAIITDPPLLFADEPSAGLDPITARELDELLLELRAEQGLAVLIITHELESIKLLADKAIYLSQGKVLWDGSLQGAMELDHPEVQDFFARRATATGRAPFLNLATQPQPDLL